MDTASEKPTWRWLAGLIVFTLLFRGGALWAMRANLGQDPDAYREIAENLLRHGQFSLGKPFKDDGVSRPIPTAYRPPLYPLVLSNLASPDGRSVSLLKVAALHLLLGVATVWLTWLAAWRFFRVAPLLAGLIVACDPILLNQQSLLMTETLAAFLAILSLWCLARFDANGTWFNAALAGGAIGLAVLCRPTFLPWLGLVGLGMLVFGGRKSEVRSQNLEMGLLGGLGWRAANAIALALAAAAVVSPWTIRNYRVFGRPIVTTTHGGYTLFLGNNEEFFAYLREGSSATPWVPSPQLSNRLLRVLSVQELKALEAYTVETEPAADEAHYALAKLEIRAHLKDFLSACLYRLEQLWSPLPHRLTLDEPVWRRVLRYAVCAWYVGVYVLAAIGVWRLRWTLVQPSWVWGVLLCLAFTAVHTFYWTNLRMRAPLMPFVALVAAAGVGGVALRPIAKKSCESN